MKFIMIILLWLALTGEIWAGVPDTNVMMRDRWAIEEVSNGIEVNLVITYYTSLTCENGPWGAVDAQQNPLIHTTVAVPRDIPLGTTFTIEGDETIYVARDRGSRKHIKWIDSDTMKIDMFVPRNSGEDDDSYYRRVNNLGITKVKGRYYLQ